MDGRLMARAGAAAAKTLPPPRPTPRIRLKRVAGRTDFFRRS
jgi:hypothetical protein